MASIISEEKDKSSSIYLPSGTKPFIQKKLATKA